MASSSANYVDTVPSEINLFEPQHWSMPYVIENEVELSATSNPKGLNPFDVKFIGSDSVFVDLANSYMSVQCKITKPGGGDLEDNVEVGPVNNVLHSLFQSIDLTINHTATNQNTTLYPYRALVENAWNHSKETANMRLVCEGFVKDTAGKHNDNKSKTGANVGLKTRSAPFAKSAIVTLTGRPHLDLFNAEKLIPPNMNIDLHFVPAKHEFVLITNTDVLYEMHIVDFKFYFKTKTIDTNMYAGMQMALRDKNYEINYTKVDIKHLNIATGISVYGQDSLYTGELPDLIGVAFVRDADMSGSRTTNPFEFLNLDITDIHLKWNSLYIPPVPYKPKFSTKAYIKEYYKCLSEVGLNSGDRAIDINPEDWANGDTWFWFKVTPGVLSPYSPRALPRTGSLKLQVSFGTATTASVNLICYAQFPGHLEINANRNVIKNGL